ncbi:MAG: hypothetical protein ACOY3P_05825 [Planctomycetota bacterium]
MLKRTIDRRRVILIDGGRIRIALDSTSPGRACLAIEAPGDVRIEARRLGPALDTNSEGSENTPESTTLGRVPQAPYRSASPKRFGFSFLAWRPVMPREIPLTFTIDAAANPQDPAVSIALPSGAVLGTAPVSGVDQPTRNRLASALADQLALARAKFAEHEAETNALVTLLSGK